MIELMQDLPAGVVGLRLSGTVSKADYDRVIVPATEDALKQHDRLRALIEIDGDFPHMEAGAMWEDFKLGMRHFTHWERIALVTGIDWLRRAGGFFSAIMPGELRTFPPGEAAAARAWVCEGL